MTSNLIVNNFFEIQTGMYAQATYGIQDIVMQVHREQPWRNMANHRTISETYEDAKAIMDSYKFEDLTEEASLVGAMQSIAVLVTDVTVGFHEIFNKEMDANIRKMAEKSPFLYAIELIDRETSQKAHDDLYQCLLAAGYTFGLAKNSS
jgi:hypothetical protein